MSFSPARLRFIALLLALCVLGLDQGSKTAILGAYAKGVLPLTLLPFFNLVRVMNTGISFGMLTSLPVSASLLITLGTSLIAGVIVLWLLRAHETHVILALGFIIGGAVGNILDRLRLGAVVDFLDFHIGHYHWPAFNVADSAIFIGVVILLFMGIYSPRFKN
jgi:signal peptidase II